MKIVVKLGTSVLTSGSRHLSRPVLVDIARQISQLRQDGHQIVIVSSGAIAAGRERLVAKHLNLSESNSSAETLRDKQVLAALGQVQLMSVWQQTFDLYDISIGQMLLTRADLDDRERYLNARDTLEGLLSAGILPVINENDAVATSEIKVGDNDNLSASVAVLAGADLLILLTDQPGLMTANPSIDSHAKLIRQVHSIDRSLLDLAGDSISGLGTGGMITKLQAAQIARCSGIDVVIAGTQDDDFLSKIVRSEGEFTWIPKTATRLESRKQWILAGPPAAGKLTLDAGATLAVSINRKSLLAKGIVAAEGSFDRGAVVSLIEEKGPEIARGIVRYSRVDISKICGRHSNEIHQVLGYHLGDAVVHRDELVIL